MRKKYLSEVINIEELLEINNNKICIISGVGSGKNTLVEKKLIKYGNILYVTSRRAKVNEILEEKVAQESITWENERDDVVTTTNYGIEKLVMNEKFGSKLSEIINHFSFIVIDEAHSLSADATYAESSFHLNTFLNYIDEKYPSKKIILMTGTPEPIQHLLSRNSYHIIDKRNECINVTPNNIKFITKQQAISIMSELPEDEKTIYYSTSASLIVKGANSLYKRLLTKGINGKNIAICMSDSSISKNKKHLPELPEICSKTKEAITEKKTLPSDTRFLLTTSTLKEGVNIEDDSIKIAFCETHLLSDIQQFAGRVRTVLDTLYIISDARQHDVDDNTFKSFLIEFFYSGKIAEASTNTFFEDQIKNANSVLYTQLGFDIGNIDIGFLFEDDYSLYSLGGDATKLFIKMIESKYQYIKFNHLSGQFELFKNRYTEQKRVHQSIYHQKWAKDLEEYCSSYNINYTPPVLDNIVDIDSISEYLSEKVGIRLIDREKDDLTRFLASSFNLSSNRPQTQTLNSKLQENELPYQLSTGNTSRNGRSKRYTLVEHIS